MQVQPITSNSFGSRNTFLRKAHYAIMPEERDLYKSLHYEAKSRLHYIKFKKASKELAEIKTLNCTNALNLAKTIYIASKEKLVSMINQVESFHAYPERFYAVDDIMAFPHRFYKTNKL